MKFWNVDQILDGVLHASASTYIFSFLGVAALFAFGFGISAWFTPERDKSSEVEKTPITTRPNEVAGKNEPINQNTTANDLHAD